MNLAEIIDRHPPGAPAVVSGGQITSYGALRQQVAALRGGLVALGVKPGDRVALVLASNWYFVSTYLAVLGIGAIVVPLNPQSPAAELQRELDPVRPALAVVGPTAQSAFATVDRKKAGLRRVLVPEGVALPDVVAFEDLLSSGPVPLVDRADNDTAVLVFTSGTAGPSKPAILTHGNLVANLDQVQSVPSAALHATDVVLGVLPLFHIYGLNGVLGLSLRAGSCLVLLQRFDAAAAVRSIREREVTVIAAVPPMYGAWLALPKLPPGGGGQIPASGDGGQGLAGGGHGDSGSASLENADVSESVTRADFATVRMAVSGASKLDSGLAAAFEARFGVRVEEGYGLTEAGPVVTVASASCPPGTIGLPVPGVEVRLVDEHGEDAYAGDPGEIWVRGPNVFPGYWEDLDATSNALTADGWLRTGDLAVADDDGYVTIVDRTKDLIIVSGFNVYPAEVEAVLVSHGDVAEAAVVGEPDSTTGERVVAYVVTEPGAGPTPEELISFCARSVARYKCPARIVFVAELAHALGGKVVRRALRDPHTGAPA